MHSNGEELHLGRKDRKWWNTIIVEDRKKEKGSGKYYWGKLRSAVKIFGKGKICEVLKMIVEVMEL